MLNNRYTALWDRQAALATHRTNGERAAGISLDEILLKLDSVKMNVEFNETLNQLLIQSEAVKNRQAASAALQIVQFLMVIIYFGVLALLAICKCVKKNRLEQQDQDMEVIEKKLQEQRDQQKSAARIAAAKTAAQ